MIHLICDIDVSLIQNRGGEILRETKGKRMKKVVVLLGVVGGLFHYAEAAIPQNCSYKVATSDTLDLSNPDNFLVVDPVNLQNPNSILSRHVRYMNLMLKRGEILETGAIEDLNGNVLEGFTVFAAEDLAHAKPIQDDDPFVLNGVVKIQYKRWKRCQ